MRKIRNLIKFLRLWIWVGFKTGYSTEVMGFKKIKGTCKTLRRVAAASHTTKNVTKDNSNKPVCFVLGNGPSLNDDINGNFDLFRMGDICCVNGFAETELYEKVKPKFYVFADPDYWLIEVSENFSDARTALFEQIVRKTSWPLTIYFPYCANDVSQFFKNASNINIEFYNNVALSGESALVNVLYDEKLGMPSAQNVLIPAIFLSLSSGYKHIVLLGADHSWHKTLTLDNANRVCVELTHFYNNENEVVPFRMGEHTEKNFTMHSALYALGLMFEGYWELETYSKHIGSKIYNASSVTYIDAFERKSISAVQTQLNTL